MPWKGIFTIDISSALKYCWKDWMGGGVCEKKRILDGMEVLWTQSFYCNKETDPQQA